MHRPNYAGIGSRDTPSAVLQTLTEVSRLLARRGHTLRSGGEEGAELACEIGSHLGDGTHEIYLPWRGYNENDSLFHTPCEAAMKVARVVHPVPEILTASMLKCQARNVQTVLGATLNDPVDFVIGYTPEGKPSGGTAVALRLARINRIPVFNLGDAALAGQCATRIVERVALGGAPANDPGTSRAQRASGAPVQLHVLKTAG